MLSAVVLVGALVGGSLLLTPFWSYDKGWWREPSTLFSAIVLLLVSVGLLLT